MIYVEYMSTKDQQRALVRHLSRLEGQLASVRSALMQEEPDCAKASATLVAASRSFDSLRCAYVACMLDTHHLVHAHTPKAKRELDLVLKVIKS
jgi:DNA-binding FrmR family transcriptional regulator